MRTLEMLLLMADLLALGVLAVPRWRHGHWLRLSAVVAMAFAFAQWGLEGPRWQMVPAYGLTQLIVVFSMARSGVAGDAGGRARRTRILIGLGVAAFAMAVVLPIVVPVFRFPPPTGPYAIGTLTYHWIDAARSEAFATDPRARRELMVQIWYPSRAQAPGPRDCGQTHPTAAASRDRLQRHR